MWLLKLSKLGLSSKPWPAGSVLLAAAPLPSLVGLSNKGSLFPVPPLPLPLLSFFQSQFQPSHPISFNVSECWPPATHARCQSPLPPGITGGPLAWKSVCLVDIQPGHTPFCKRWPGGRVSFCKGLVGFLLQLFLKHYLLAKAKVKAPFQR